VEKGDIFYYLWENFEVLSGEVRGLSISLL